MDERPHRAGGPGRGAKRRLSIPIATIAGVTLRVHVTFLALIALVALAAGDAGESAVGAVGWLLALFACVIAHELAHSLVARSKGIAVHEIDLLPFGGVSRMERIPERWRDEAAIAVAGPIASVGVALVAFGLAAAVRVPLLPPDPWDGPVLARLGWVNLLLAGFNLLPAFPLDGGRVFRALLERDRSRVEATRQAARVSRMLAAAMIGVGLMVNAWLVIIGVFVIMAGGAEEAAVLIHAALGSTPARELAVPCPITLSGATPAADASHLAALHPQPAYPVLDDAGGLVGLVTGAELRRAAPATPASDLAAGTTADSGVSLEAVAELVSEGPVAITSGGRLLGVITLDILNDHLQRRLRDADIASD
jgi:Zn-dependent protease